MKNKILLLIPQLGAGGAEKVITILANDWAERGHHVYLRTFDDEKSFFPLSDQVDLVRHSRGMMEKCLPSKLASVNEILSFRRVVRRVKPDVILSFLPAANVIAIFSCIFLRVRVVIAERNDVSHRPLTRFWSFARFCMYRHANLIVVNRKSNIQKLSGIVTASKIKFLPNPVDLKSMKVASEISIRRTKVVLSVGRLVEQKQFDLLIRAFAESLLHRKGWKLVIVGEGPQRVELEHLVAELGIGGFCSLEHVKINVWEKYKQASVFALFSAYEGMPNVLLEAMAYGLLPVVTPGVGDLCTEIRECNESLVLDAEDVDRAGAILKTACINLHESSIVRNAVREIAEKYEVDSVSNQWLRSLFDQSPSLRQRN